MTSPLLCTVCLSVHVLVCAYVCYLFIYLAAPIEDKMRKIHLRWFGHVQKRVTGLRWFGHVQRRPVDLTVRKNNSLAVIGTTRMR